jgi:GT2 family glycosyltransferase
MRLAIVIVHYHTPALVAEALAALAADLGPTGIEAEWLLVDNGSDAAEREILDGLPLERIGSGENLGYAAGANLGVAHSRAEAIVLMNPDVLVLPGCIPALLAELERGAEIVGPLSYWDRGHRLVLPPAEERTRTGELLLLLADRGEGWAARARRRWRKNARRHWESGRALPSYDLSGSLLAFRRSTWEKVGPFDPGFRLFFEETDWLRRARRTGVPARYVPAARAVHLYNQSAVREPHAQEWFEASAERFRSRHYGAWFPPLLHALADALPAELGAHAVALEPLPAAGLDLAALGRPFPLWLEVSPNPTGFPAAVERIDSADAGPWRLPEEIAAQFPTGGLVIQVTDRDGLELLRRSLPARPAEGAE